VKIRAILLPGAKILGGAAGRAVVGPRLGGVLGEHEGGEHQTTELAAGVGGGDGCGCSPSCRPLAAPASERETRERTWKGGGGVVAVCDGWCDVITGGVHKEIEVSIHILAGVECHF
jgi:hypothetical protein